MEPVISASRASHFDLAVMISPQKKLKYSDFHIYYGGFYVFSWYGCIHGGFTMVFFNGFPTLQGGKHSTGGGVDPKGFHRSFGGLVMNGCWCL